MAEGTRALVWQRLSATEMPGIDGHGRVVRQTVLAVMIAVVLLAAGPRDGKGWSRGPRSPRVARPRLLVGVSEKGWVDVVGTCDSRGRWRSLEPKDSQVRALLPRGGKWLFYHVGEQPISAWSTALWPYTIHGGARRYAAQVSALRGAKPGKMWLAVSGAGRVDRGAVTVLPNRDDSLVQRVRERLRGSREPGVREFREAQIQQNLAADLNGDSREDRVLTLGNGNTNLVLAVLTRSDGRLVPQVLSRTVSSGEQYPDDTHVLAAEVFAIADIDGNGTREVAVSWGIPDGGGVDVYRLRENTFRREVHYWEAIA